MCLFNVNKDTRRKKSHVRKIVHHSTFQQPQININNNKNDNFSSKIQINQQNIETIAAKTSNNGDHATNKHFSLFDLIDRVSNSIQSHPVPFSKQNQKKKKLFLHESHKIISIMQFKC